MRRIMSLFLILAMVCAFIFSYNIVCAVDYSTMTPEEQQIAAAEVLADPNATDEEKAKAELILGISDTDTTPQPAADTGQDTQAQPDTTEAQPDVNAEANSADAQAADAQATTVDKTAENAMFGVTSKHSNPEIQRILEALAKANDEKTKKLYLEELADTKKAINDHTVWVLMNGLMVKFDVFPYLKDGRTLVPIRAIAVALNATTAWNADTKEVTITKGDTVIKLVIDNAFAIVSDTAVKLDAPATITGDRTFVPLRFVAESFHLKVDWDDASKSVLIETDLGSTTNEQPSAPLTYN